MNFPAVIYILGRLWQFLALAFVPPLLVSLWYGDGTWPAFLIALAMTVTIAQSIVSNVARPTRVSHRESFAVVTLSWLSFAAFGALPLWLSHITPSWTDAFFEAVSGITTTGSTVLTGLDDMAPGILLWRSMLQWMGGMGMIVLGLAILPLLGVAGNDLFKAEAPGPSQDRLQPRIEETAKILWQVYLGLTATVALLLWLSGFSFFDAVNHGLTTMATGGYSTRDASIGGFNNPLAEWIIIFFMLAGGTNFALHFNALRGRPRVYWRNEEFRVYIVLFFLAVFCVLPAALTHSTGWAEGIRNAAFVVAALISTTGYGTTDYELWPVATHIVLLALMWIGGTAGSTAGGMKTVRGYLLLKHAYQQLFLLVHPRAVRPVKLNKRTVPDNIVQTVLGFFALFVGIFFLGVVTLTWEGLDIISTIAAVSSALGNIGPGLGSVGPTDTYAHLSALSKWVLGLCMVMGRLELFTVIVLLLPDTWRR